MLEKMFKPISPMFIMLAVILGLVFLNLKQCNDKKDMKNKNNIYLSNLEALKDTIRIEKNKNGEIQYSKAALIAENGSLKELNSELHEEVKKQKGKVIYIQSSNGTITKDTSHQIHGTVKVINDTTFEISDSLTINYDSNNYKKFLVVTTISVDSNRKVKVLKTNLKKDDLGFNLVTGLKEENGKLRIFMKSDYPNLQFTKIDGALIDPKKSDVIRSFFPNKKWGLGIQGGYGINSQFRAGFYVGVGVQYNLWTW